MSHGEPDTSGRGFCGGKGEGRVMSDLIDRQTAIKALYTEIIKRRLLDDVNDGLLDEFDTESILRTLPSAHPERTKGRWIDDTYCDQCGWTNEVESGFIGSVKGFHFCPNCGAEMRSKEDGE